MSEGFPGTATEERPASDSLELSAELEAEFQAELAKRSLEDFEITFGVRESELRQMVPDQKGNPRTLAAFLNDEECPVPARLARIFKNEGIEGVENSFRDIQSREPDFKATVSESTRALHAENLKKK